MPISKITLVLVHGAWAECASWTEVILPLQKQGFGVVCPPLPLTSLSVWKDRPSWFLVVENDRMIPAKTQHFQAGRLGATERVYAVDYSPMLTSPNVVVDVLLEAIRSTFKDASSLILERQT
jgi:hypothetical protein